jgi:hydroxyacylglutathione hydrolase
VVRANPKRGAVVDPGGDVSRILRAVEANGVELEKILVTHGHIDHAGAVAELAERLSLPIEGPQREDQFWIDGMPAQSKMFGLPMCVPSRPTAGSSRATRCASATSRWRSCIAPDTRRGTSSSSTGRPLAIVGDVLFQGSIGRTDFPKGDFDT